MSYTSKAIQFDNYKEEQQAFYALLHHNSQNGQIFALQKKDTKVTQKSSYKVEQLLFNNNEADCYVSLATFKSSKRSKEQLFNRSTMYIDLDCHAVKRTDMLTKIKEDTCKLLEKAFATGELPVPTIITDSGRGFGLFYVLEKSIANVAATQKSVSLFYGVYHGLVKKVKEVVADSEMEVDTKVTDVTRVARVPGTINSKSGTMCRLLHKGNYYNLKDLKEFCLFEKKEKQQKKCEVIKFDSHLKGFLKVRLERLQKIQDLRGDKCVDSCRELMAFIAYSALTQIYDKRTAEEMLMQFNNRFTQPLPIGELHQLIKTTNQHKVLVGKYAGATGFYPFADKTIIDLLDLSEEEVKAVGFRTGWKRDAVAQEKRENKKKRNEDIVALIENSDLTYKEIAKRFDISEKTVQRLAAKHGVQRYIKKNEKLEKDASNFFENKKDIFYRESWCGGIWGDFDPSALPSLLATPLHTLYLDMLSYSDVELACKFLTICQAYPTVSIDNGFDLLQKLSILLTDYGYNRQSAVHLDDFATRFKALKALLDGKDLYIQGIGGTGKSTFVSSYMDFFKHKNFKVVAPTGVAADHMQGDTIHSFFGFGLDLQPSEDIYKLLKDIDILVIDELSMVDLQLFDKMIDSLNVCEKEYGKRPQLIMCGDIKQQGPVSGEYAFMSKRTSILRENVFVFTSCVRQKDDTIFGKALQYVSVGDRRGVDYINTHATIGVKDLEASLEKGSLYLCGYRSAVERINDQMIEKHKQDKSYREFTDDRGNVTPAFVGMPVIFTLNRKKFKNGTRGIIKQVSRKFVIISIDGKLVKVAREMMFDEQGQYLSMPFEPCYAMTVHKSQGLTLDKVILDPICFADGQLYTALSRVRKLRDITLVRKISYSDIKVSEAVMEYLDSVYCA